MTSFYGVRNIILATSDIQLHNETRTVRRVYMLKDFPLTINVHDQLSIRREGNGRDKREISVNGDKSTFKFESSMAIY